MSDLSGCTVCVSDLHGYLLCVRPTWLYSVSGLPDSVKCARPTWLHCVRPTWRHFVCQTYLAAFCVSDLHGCILCVRPTRLHSVCQTYLATLCIRPTWLHCVSDLHVCQTYLAALCVSDLPGCILLGGLRGLLGVALVVQVADKGLEERHQTGTGHCPVLVVTCRRQYKVNVNQTNTGTVSKATLGTLLGDGWSAYGIFRALRYHPELN